MRSRLQMAAQAVGGVTLLMALIGCAGGYEIHQPIKWSDEMVKELLDGVERIRSIEKNLAKDHPREGVTALDFVNRLKREGFVCRIQYRSKTYHSDGLEGKSFGFESKLVPSISCIRDPDVSSECKYFWIGAMVDWPDITAPFQTLAAQLSSTRLLEPTWFVCKTSPLADDDKAAIADGIAKGSVLTIE